MRRWRGLKGLVHDAVDATTDLVGDGHESAHRGVRRAADRIDPLSGPVRAVSGAVRVGTVGTLGAVKAVNRVVETLTDLAIDGATPIEIDPESPPPIPMRSDIVGSAEWIADASLGAVNGAVGHHLSARDNGLDLGLALRHRDRYVDDAHLEGALVVLVHGLGTTEWSWCLDAEAMHGDPATTFGSLLERDLGVAPVYARYNTGRRVPDNGRALALALERVASRADRVVLIGHSMGGLVSRAACHVAHQEGLGWLRSLDLVISLGTPHRGAPLARFGQAATLAADAIDLPATKVLAGILAGRSAGVRDLEHGDVALDPDATAAPEDRVVPLLDGVRYAFFSATVGPDPSHPVSRMLGDLLVFPSSAAGPIQTRSFPIRTGNFGGVAHHQIQSHPDVYTQVRALVAERGPPLAQ